MNINTDRLNMKLLYVLNVANRVNNFSYTSMLAAKELDIEFHIAGNWSYQSDYDREEDERKYRIQIHQIDFDRSPYSLKNIKAYRQLCALIKAEGFDAIHCNTPIGGVLGRIAGKKFGIKKVIYQAHGFHFYEGAPIKNWLFYYPVEKALAHLTDTCIAINSEDYVTAQKLRLRNNGKVYYVPGVGIDLGKYQSVACIRESKRKEMGITDEVVFISVGDLIPRKNYETAIRAVAKSGCKNIRYWICGTGPVESKLKQLAEQLNVSDQVKLLGYRIDVAELLNAADVFVLTSLQEGLPRSTSEAMASGLPCLISSIRGNIDLIENGKGGWLCDPKNSEEFAKGIIKLARNHEIRQAMSSYNLERIKRFDLSIVTATIKKIYQIELSV